MGYAFMYSVPNRCTNSADNYVWNWAKAVLHAINLISGTGFATNFEILLSPLASASLHLTGLKVWAYTREGVETRLCEWTPDVKLL